MTMSEQTPQPNMNRRGFLKAAALTTAAAAATGAGAALLKPELLQQVAKPTPVPLVANVPPVVSASLPTTNANEMLAQLAAVRAENMRLQTELDAANRSLDALRQIQSQPSQEAQILQEQLGSANQQLTVLAGLVGLYEQLEKLDLGEKIEEGVGFVSEAFTNLVDDLPTLADGLAFGEQVLDEFEGHVPLLESGRSWLGSHLAKVGGYYTTFETVLQRTADNVGPVLNMLQQWFDSMLKWLPFGLGKVSLEIMAAATELVREMPNTLHGADINIAQPLDVWLKKENGTAETHIQQRLFKPLREQSLQPAKTTVSKVETAKAVYDEKIVTSLGTAVENRRIIKRLIDTYRENHNL